MNPSSSPRIGLFGIGLDTYWPQFTGLKERLDTQGPAHHCAVGVGHVAPKIRKLGRLIGVKTVQVC